MATQPCHRDHRPFPHEIAATHTMTFQQCTGVNPQIFLWETWVKVELLSLKMDILNCTPSCTCLSMARDGGLIFPFM